MKILNIIKSIPEGAWKPILIMLLFCFGSTNIYAQCDSVFHEVDFIEYLIHKGEDEMVIFSVNNTSLDDMTAGAIDSLLYFKGLANYRQKQLDSSIATLSGVGKASVFYNRARFIAGYNAIYLQNYDQATTFLGEIHTDNPVLNELRGLQLSGLSLVQRDTLAYRKEASYFTYTHFAMANEQKVLDGLYRDICHFKPKSYFTAAMMSAIVPGSGKIYAGKAGQGIYTFLASAIFAGMALESYYKTGPSSIRTIFFGSAFFTFYVGNIYGSVAAVKKYRDDFNNETDYRILYNLHIPLRNILL